MSGIRAPYTGPTVREKLEAALQHCSPDAPRKRQRAPKLCRVTLLDLALAVQDGTPLPKYRRENRSCGWLRRR